ncbi:lytic transglycosylase domain-containing protein [Marinobacter subterrani]|uniref:lytic transglycosylase domain-containing protein n=1 Tax=Marinobacter subterrani TaxID=1658765 RepID=UPI002352539E|nr:lytic transglycosylase domain-containing protein [Marinobacter subterrani]
MFDVPPPPTVPPETPVEMVRKLEQPSQLTFGCLTRISQRYQVHPLILKLVASVEGGWSGAKIKNSNGTFDLGLMQINTIHLDTLSEYGLTAPMIQNNDCINLGVSAWYIRTVTQDQAAAGTVDYFRAIARYHSKNEPYITRYTNKLIEAYRDLIEEHGGL